MFSKFIDSLASRIAHYLAEIKSEEEKLFHDVEGEFLSLEEIIKDFVETADKATIKAIAAMPVEDLSKVNALIGPFLSDIYGLAFPQNKIVAGLVEDFTMQIIQGVYNAVKAKADASVTTPAPVVEVAPAVAQ